MSRDEEVAAKNLSPSIIEAAYAAAKSNQGLQMRCPWCSESVLGADFPPHAAGHLKAIKPGMTAIILAGGKGTRLAPFPAPKCLLPINGVPIIHRLLAHLLVENAQYVERAIICTGYRGSDIERAVVGHGWAKVTFSDRGEDAQMGKRLLQARLDMHDDKGRVLICYGDDLADVDIGALLSKHTHENTEYPGMTFTAAYTKTAGGTVDIDAEGDVHIVDEASRVINIGFVVVEPEYWAQLKPEDGLSDWINRVSEKCGAVKVYYHEGRRATVNTLADLKAAEEIWK